MDKPTSTTVLSARDFERFVELCENPPEPTEYAKQAVKRYKEAIKSGKLVIKEVKD